MSDPDDSSPEVPFRVTTPDMAQEQERSKEDSQSSQSRKNPFRFPIPDNYEEANGQKGDKKFIRDAFEEETELWLIRVPNDFDSEKLNETEITLNGGTFFSAGNGKQYEIQANASPSVQINDVTLLACSKGKKLKPVKPFKGQLTIVETSALPPITLPPTPPSTVMELPTGLGQRFQPFGSDGDAIQQGNKSKKRKKEKKTLMGRLLGKDEPVHIKKEHSLEMLDKEVPNQGGPESELDLLQKKPKKRKYKERDHLSSPEMTEIKIKKEKFK